jgi:hypothetical protein
LSSSSAPSSSPSSLAAFQSALLLRLTAWPRGVPPLPDAWLARGDARASAEERVGVYAHMYGARLAETLAATFPRLARLIGEDQLAELALAYAADEPSRHPSLRFFGRTLSTWLTRHRPDAPAWSALAELEWARSDVFDELDEPCLTAEVLQSRAAEKGGDLPLRLITAHRFVATSLAAGELWDAAGDGEKPDAKLDATVLTQSARPEQLVVWRQGVVVYHRSLGPEEQAALATVANGTTLGALCELASRSHSDNDGRGNDTDSNDTDSNNTDSNDPAIVTQRVFGWIGTWLNDELLAF